MLKLLRLVMSTIDIIGGLVFLRAGFVNNNFGLLLESLINRSVILGVALPNITLDL
jgi:hypothetical protein